MPAVDVVVLVPVKAFTDAKARLAGVLSPAQREALARWTAERVIAAAGALPVFVACDDEAVADWARGHGAEVLWRPGIGLNAAVDRSVTELHGSGAAHVVVAHGDLPLAASLGDLVSRGALTLVPDAALDGSNVVALPTGTGFEFAYGPGSYRRHLERARALGLPVTVRRDPRLAIDIDTPTDLTHPLVQEVLPEWLRTNPVNPTPPSR